MAKTHPGRFTADMDGDFVVFLIGMRFNRVRQVHKWLPIFVAMPRMLAKLAKDPSKGLLAHRVMLDGKGITVLQYWRSLADLEHFARSPDDPHLAAWRRFNRRVGAGNAVGIWHETFPVTAGSWDALYGNMPAFGLALAGRHRQAAGLAPANPA